MYGIQCQNMNAMMYALPTPVAQARPHDAIHICLVI